MRIYREIPAMMSNAMRVMTDGEKRLLPVWVGISLATKIESPTIRERTSLSPTIMGS